MAGVGIRSRRFSYSTPRVDMEHPLANGLIIAQYNGVVVFPRTVRMTLDRAVNLSGPGIFGDVVTGSNLGILPAQTDTTSFTYTVLGAMDGGSTLTAYIGYRLGGGPGLSFSKLGRTGVFDYYSNGNNRGIGSTIDTKGKRMICGIKNGLTLNLFVDGLLTHTATYTTGQLSKNSANVLVMGDNETPGVASPLASIGIIHSRALTQQERDMLLVDPFCMLKA